MTNDDEVRADLEATLMAANLVCASLLKVSGENDPPMFSLECKRDQSEEIWQELRLLVSKNRFWPVIADSKPESYEHPRVTRIVRVGAAGTKELRKLFKGKGSQEMLLKIEDKLAEFEKKAINYPHNIDFNEIFGLVIEQSKNLPDLLNEIASFAANAPDSVAQAQAEPLDSLDDVIDSGEDLDFAAWLASAAHANGSNLRAELWTDRNKDERQRAARVAAENILIMLVPTTLCWRVPAYMKFGGFAGCPPPHVHLAAFKSWNYRFEAEVVSMTQNAIELKINKPITEAKEAFGIANEHLIYCPDAVFSVSSSLTEYASKLIGAETWRFSWKQ